MITECEKNGIEISDIERLSPGLLHTKLGAFYAKNVYGVEDVDVLSAITYHTTGRPDMGLLEEIIYVADYIEPSRPALPYIDEMRACAFSDLHRATLFELKSVITKINKDNGVMDKRTEETYEFYKKLVEG
jgi:hydrolase, HD family